MFDLIQILWWVNAPAYRFSDAYQRGHNLHLYKGSLWCIRNQMQRVCSVEPEVQNEILHPQIDQKVPIKDSWEVTNTFFLRRWLIYQGCIPCLKSVTVHELLEYSLQALGSQLIHEIIKPEKYKDVTIRHREKSMASNSYCTKVPIVFVKQTF